MNNAKTVTVTDAINAAGLMDITFSMNEKIIDTSQAQHYVLKNLIRNGIYNSSQNLGT